MKHKAQQFEFDCGSEAFKLAQQSAVDHDRIQAEQAQRERDKIQSQQQQAALGFNGPQ